MAQILFVDDDAVTLEILSKAAKVLGHEPLPCSSGTQALALAAACHPDLILLDMMMPDMDGIDVIAGLRAQPETAGIPVVVLSAGVDLNDAEVVTRAGAQGYLAKPVSLKMLLDTISRFTGAPLPS